MATKIESDMSEQKKFKIGDRVHLIEDSKADIFGMPPISKTLIGIVLDVREDMIFVEYPALVRTWGFSKYFELA